jgi:shikimate dehydrogenase
LSQRLEKVEERLYGLIGKSLPHSFSPSYFAEKFAKQGIQHTRYQKWELPEIGGISELLLASPEIKGFNVTIPYKQEILPFLDAIDPVAREIGAVNTVLVEVVDRRDGQKILGRRLTGFNTDAYGFRDSLKPLLKAGVERALVLGTGGSSKAVCYVLRHHLLIVNTTPLGQYPAIAERPALLYSHLGPSHILYDLIYNPSETQFLKEGISRGAQVQNGYNMLCLQAEYSWEIWQKGAGFSFRGLP